MTASAKHHTAVTFRCPCVRLLRILHRAHCTSRNTPSMTPNTSSHRFTILLFCFAALGGLVLPISAQSHNETSVNQLERANAQNALDLVKHYKEKLKIKLWEIYNRTQVLPGMGAVNRSSQNGCFGQLKSALESPVDTVSFEWLLQSMFVFLLCLQGPFDRFC